MRTIPADKIRLMQSLRLTGTPDDDEPGEVDDTDAEYDASVDDELTKEDRHV